MKSLALLCGALLLVLVSAQFDSRAYWSNCPFYIESQGQCGSCYAFSSTEVISDRVCITTGSIPNAQVDSMGQISPEYVLDCNGANGGAPCNGGYPSNVMNFYAQCSNGACAIPTADGVSSSPSQSSMWGGCYPYDAGSCQEGGGGSCPNWQCAAQCQDGTTPWTFSGSLVAASVSPGPSYYQAEIQTNGPIVGTMAVCQSFMTFYQQNSGPAVYPGPCSQQSADYVGGHAVKIVGWETINGVSAWIVANSWSTGWGDNGYFYLQVGADTCGIESAGATTMLVNGQTGASGTAVGSAATAEFAAQSARLPAPGRATTVSGTAQWVQPFVQHYIDHVNRNSTTVHTLHSIATIQSQVVTGVYVTMSLTTQDTTGTLYDHSAGVIQDPTMTLHTSKSIVVPISPATPSSTVIGLAVGLGGGLLVIMLAAFVYWCVRRQRQSVTSGDGVLARRLLTDSEA